MSKPKNIYLAGKIGPNDWRFDIVSNLANRLECSDDEDAVTYSSWQILNKAIFDKHNYTGPYFIKAHHFKRLFHGEDTHGVNATFSSYEDGGHYIKGVNNRKQHYVTKLCYEAIDRADIVFAWIEDFTCFGTLNELGYAAAKNKIILIAGQERIEDLWFSYSTADMVNFLDSLTPGEALRRFLNTIEYRELLDSLSPIEVKFWECWQNEMLNLTLNGAEQLKLELQYEVLDGKYRLDFAHLPTKTAIELDGFEAHSSTDQIANDRRRQREIENDGWRFIRFGGKEIYHHVGQCVGETVLFIIKALKANNLLKEPTIEVTTTYKALPEPIISNERLRKAKEIFNSLNLD